MGASYRQFCPVSKAVELLDERWTLLVVRELLWGSTRFNEIRRGVPRMSPALLSARLASLTKAGVIERRAEGREVSYALTPAGEELGPVIEALGVWGLRWGGRVTESELDPKLLMWTMHNFADRSELPPGRTVVHFRFPELGRAGSWWMTLTPDSAEVCDVDPGHEVDVTVTTDLAVLTDVYLANATWAGAVRAGTLAVSGPTALRRLLPRMFFNPNAAAVPRPALAR